MELTQLLTDCDDHVREELSCMPEVEDVTSFDPSNDSPPITARRWLRVEDVVAVVADLKSSTKLGLNKYAQSTASIYEAALHPVVGHAARERTPFFEHRSLIVLEDGKPRLVGVEATDVNAWRSHMADGSSVRMRALEVGCAAELAAGRMISAMATARAHMEVAGLASYCCRALYDSGRSGDFAPVERLIVQTYFGSNMRIQVKGTPALDPHLRPEEVRPLRPGDLIKSMDDCRAAGDAPGTRCQVTYGVLSEYAHPVMRATNASFTNVLGETAEGWELQYHEEHRLGEGEARMPLEALLDNIRIVHACAALLHAAEVKGGGDPLRLQTPSPDEAHDIYVNLLQQEAD